MERSRDAGRSGRPAVESILLAGGFSRRFGDREKITAEIAGEPMLRRVARTVEPLSRRLVVSCRREQRDALAAALGGTDAPDPPDVPVSFAFDDRPDGGPLAGIAASVGELGDAAATLVLGGDFPLVRTETFEGLLSALGGEFDHAFGDGFGGAFDDATPVEAALPSVDGRLQPLCAACRTDALRAGVASVGEPRDRAVLSAFDALSVRTVPAAELPGGAASFGNVNTPADLRELSRTIDSGFESASESASATGGGEQ